MVFNRDKIEVLSGVTYRIQTPCGPMYVTVNSHEDRIVEVFAKLGKAGGCATCQVDAQARLVSIALQEGADIQRIIKQLVGNKCSASGAEIEGEAISCPDGIGKILLKEFEKIKKE